MRCRAHCNLRVETTLLEITAYAFNERGDPAEQTNAASNLEKKLVGRLQAHRGGVVLAERSDVGQQLDFPDRMSR